MVYCLTWQNGKKEGDHTDITSGVDWPYVVIYDHIFACFSKISNSQAMGWLQYMHTECILFRMKWAKLEHKWSITEQECGVRATMWTLNRCRVPNVLYATDERLPISSEAPFSYSSMMHSVLMLLFPVNWLIGLLYLLWRRYLCMGSGRSVLWVHSLV